MSEDNPFRWAYEVAIPWSVSPDSFIYLPPSDQFTNAVALPMRRDQAGKLAKVLGCVHTVVSLTGISITLNRVKTDVAVRSQSDLGQAWVRGLVMWNMIMRATADLAAWCNGELLEQDAEIVEVPQTVIHLWAALELCLAWKLDIFPNLPMFAPIPFVDQPEQFNIEVDEVIGWLKASPQFDAALSGDFSPYMNVTELSAVVAPVQ